MKIVLIIIALLNGNLVFGAGGVFDLVPSFFNFFGVGLFLIFILRKKISKYFEDFSRSIKEQVESSEIKAKETKIMLDEQRLKLKRLPDEIEKIKEESYKYFEKLKNELTKENLQRINNMKEEAALKINSEKSEYANSLMNYMIEKIISSVKKESKGNSADITKELTNKLLR
jgi:F0F1-type ATP synthase membrane subunit b/b'